MRAAARFRRFLPYYIEQTKTNQTALSGPPGGVLAGERRGRAPFAVFCFAFAVFSLLLFSHPFRTLRKDGRGGGVFSVKVLEFGGKNRATFYTILLYEMPRDLVKWIQAQAPLIFGPVGGSVPSVMVFLRTAMRLCASAFVIFMSKWAGYGSMAVCGC